MSVNAYSVARILRSLRWFAIGKLISAPLSFLLVLVLNARMSTHEYAAYVAAIAVLEIGVAIGTLGIDWLTQTVIAGIRVRGSQSALRRAVLMLSLLAVVPYALLAAVMMTQAPGLSEALGGVTSPEVLRLYAVVLLLEGTNRMHRDNLLAVLMVQGAVQLSQLSRVVSMFVAVALILLLSGGLDAMQVAQAEIVASLVSMAFTISSIGRHVLAASGPQEPRTADLSDFVGKRQFRFAAHAYASFMFTLLLGTELTTALVARYLGHEATATFGFISKLLETGRRFLPMDLFYGVIRPATIGRYESSDGDRAALVRDASLFLKANLLVLGAGMSLALGIGDWLVTTLSRGSVVTPPMLMAAMLATAWAHSLRRTVELIAFVSGNSDLFLRASVSCVLAPLTLLVLLPAGASLYGVAATLMSVDVLFSVIVIVQLRSRFGSLAMDAAGWIKFGLASIAGGAAAVIADRLQPGTMGALMAGALALLVYAFAVRISHALSRTDLAYIRAVVRPRGS